MSLKFLILVAFLAVACVLPEIKTTSESSTRLPRKFCNKNVPKSDRESDMLKKLHLITLGLMLKTVNENIVKLKESSAKTADDEIMTLEERAVKLKKAEDNLKNGKEIETSSKMELAKLFLMKSTKLTPNQWEKLPEDKRNEFSEELRCMIEGLWKDELKDYEWKTFLEELWPRPVRSEL